MNQLIFDFEDYKSFLKAWIASQPHKGHGSKAKIARAVNCQTAYISQVVLSSSHLSLEQSERLAGFFQLSEEETEFFFLLVQKDRAGSETLKRYFLKQIKKIQNRRAQLKNRVGEKAILNLDAQATYFSSWIYSAIHVLATIFEYQSKESISRRLQLPTAILNETLAFLISSDLLIEENGKLKSGSARMHLPHDSPLISKHHMNWRLRAIRDLEIRRDDNLHYSSCVSISQKDVVVIREQLLRAIEATKKIIKGSSEEMLYSFCLDFFEV